MQKNSIVTEHDPFDNKKTTEENECGRKMSGVVGLGGVPLTGESIMHE